MLLGQTAAEKVILFVIFSQNCLSFVTLNPFMVSNTELSKGIHANKSETSANSDNLCIEEVVTVVPGPVKTNPELD